MYRGKKRGRGRGGVACGGTSCTKKSKRCASTLIYATSGSHESHFVAYTSTWDPREQEAAKSAMAGRDWASVKAWPGEVLLKGFKGHKSVSLKVQLQVFYRYLSAYLISALKWNFCVVIVGGGGGRGGRRGRRGRGGGCVH